MKFLAKKEDIFNGIRLVANVAAMKSLQPVLANILIETVDDNAVKLTATDFDLTISTTVDAKVENAGKITLPAKKLNDIVSRLSDKLITFELNPETNSMNITCDNTKFDIIGISADEFPNVMENISISEENAIDIDMKPFVKAMRQASFAAANFEANNLLSGVVCDISEEMIEMASTDGNRLARVREKINNIEHKTSQLIIPSKTTTEFMKMSSLIDDESVKIYTDKTKLVIKTEKSMMISRIMEGQYPKYNQLIPKESPKTAIVNKNKLISALERVSIMVNDKSFIKFEFTENKLTLKADTPDAGASEESFEIEYNSEDLTIAFNYKYVIDGLKNMDTDEVKIGLNTNLSATVFMPNMDINSNAKIYLTTFLSSLGIIR